MVDSSEYAVDVAAAALRALARSYGELNWTHFGEKLTPIPLALSQDSGRLGCFSADPRRIVLARSLVTEQSWGAVCEVLKHEMAHQFVYEVLGCTEEPAHGPQFQQICARLGIDAAASGVPVAAETEARTPVLARVKKLLALAGSDNQHEAETAMRAAHRLMLKHNLELPPEDAQDNTGYSFRHLGRATGRISEAESVLASLLGEFFFVQPIWVSVFRLADRKWVSVLEVTGRLENLSMAEYVHGFLTQAGEALWKAHKRRHGLSRNADRRAFVAGVMRGFADKLRSERQAQAETGLVWVGSSQADAHFRRRHPRVRASRYSSSAGSAAASQGRAAGRNLVLNQPLGTGPSGRKRLLPS